MSINQALSAAVAGVNVTQQSLVGHRRERGERQHARLRRRKPQSGRGRDRPAQAGTSVDTTGINRDLNTLLAEPIVDRDVRRILCRYTTSQLYQQLQQIYGTPGSSTSFDGIFDNFTSALQSLSTDPGSYSSQAAVVERRASGGAKSQFDDHEHPAAAHPSRAGHRQRRSNGQHGVAADRPDQPAARRQPRLRQCHGDARGPARPGHHPAHPADERQRGAEFQQPNFGLHRHRQQLVAASQASQMLVRQRGTLSATRNGAPIRARTAPGRSR
jgi:hypothetical protein